MTRNRLSFTRWTFQASVQRVPLRSCRSNVLKKINWNSIELATPLYQGYRWPKLRTKVAIFVVSFWVVL